MQIVIIAAQSKNRVIGIENRLPWRLPEDLRRFRDLTMGKWVVMGRRTFESIGKPLPGRHNIVLTHRRDYHPAGCHVAHSLKEAQSLAREAGELWVIGGESVYCQALPLAQKLILTTVETEVEGDAFFPCFDFGEWERKDRQRHASSPYEHTVLTLERKRQTAIKGRRRKISSHSFRRAGTYHGKANVYFRWARGDAYRTHNPAAVQRTPPVLLRRWPATVGPDQVARHGRAVRRWKRDQVCRQVRQEGWVG